MELSKKIIFVVSFFSLMITGRSISAQSAIQVGDNLRDSIVSILIADEGEPLVVATGLVVRSDGLILTSYDVVKNARKTIVKLRSGEVFEHAEVIVSDEARNLAVLRINGAGLASMQNSVLEEALVGSRVYIIASSADGTQTAESGILTSVVLADEIMGAGRGFRVVRFNAPMPSRANGAVLVSERGRVVGVLTAPAASQTRNYAVPITSVIGLIRSVGLPTGAEATDRVGSTPSTLPLPIPQRSVLVPQRPVLPLEGRGPGSVVIKPARPADILLTSKTIYVVSRTQFFKPEHLINALRKRTEIDQWGLAFVDDPRVADLILTLDHVLFTYKFTFSIAHQRTGVIVATGNVIVWDGNLGGEKMADRVIQKVAAVRAQIPTK